ELNPYYFSAPDLADWYGLNTTFSTDYFGVVAHYAASNEDVQDVEDGSIAHVELNTEIDGVTAAVGYIKTDKDGGTGTISAA
ncbi:Opr family porin, partial [Aliarcobacter butzleri]|uniref:Opr family porin n=1 Tax=Aliarcobacter butzleri TaxID=28197 RepID=UPI003B226BD8